MPLVLLIAAGCSRYSGCARLWKRYSLDLAAYGLMALRASRSRRSRKKPVSSRWLGAGVSHPLRPEDR